jgi:hypothetical protein
LTSQLNMRTMLVLRWGAAVFSTEVSARARAVSVVKKRLSKKLPAGKDDAQGTRLRNS